MSNNDKNSNFTHDQEFISDKFEIISYVIEDDTVKSGDLFYLEDNEDFDSYEGLKNYLYFKDEDSSNMNNLINTGDSGGGTVVLRAPTKFSWGVILGGLTLAFNLVVSGTALYFYQSNLNEKMMTRIENLEEKIDNLSDNVYNKKEGDLMNENIKLELSKQNEMITRIENRYR